MTFRVFIIKIVENQLKREGGKYVGQIFIKLLAILKGPFS